ncbi:MAG: glycosyl transferase, partial [Anaerolineae bacterium]|nr:glycosyl transferase [Anaerolineae bacterium]
MNIGIVTTWFERGAAYVSKAYTDVLSQDNNVFIYARGGEENSKGDPRWNLPNVTYGKTYSPLDPRHQPFTKYTRNYVDMLHFEGWLSANDMDLVIFNEERGVSSLRRTKKLGYTIGAYVDYYTNDTLNQFSIYDFLLCNTKRHYSVFRGFPNTIYIPWGTDITTFCPHIRNNRSTGEGTVRFFHSAGYGGVNNRKGTDLLVKAFQKIRGDCKLIIHS